MEQPVSFLQIFLKRWWIILLITGLVFAASWFVYSNKPKSTFASEAVTVAPTRIYPSNGQLIMQADTGRDTTLLVATSSAWVQDPGNVRQVLAAANVTPGDESLKGLAKYFKVVQGVEGASTYQVQYAGQNKEEVNQISKALQASLQNQANQYNQRDNADLKIQLRFGELLTTEQDSALPLTPLAGLLGGLLFSLFAVALVERRAH